MKKRRWNTRGEGMVPIDTGRRLMAAWRNGRISSKARLRILDRWPHLSLADRWRLWWSTRGIR